MNFQPLCYRSDVVFEGRNKSYGAYVMRKIYEKRIITSALLAILLFAVAMGGPVLYNSWTAKEGEDVVHVVAKTTKLPPPPEVKPPPPPELPPPPPPPVKIETIKFLPPEPQDDEKVEKDEMVKVEDIKTQTAAITQDGDKKANPVEEEPIKTEAPPATVDVPKADEVYTVVANTAEYPGGNKAMGKFMNKNLKYPPRARRMNITGKVFVKFIVRKTGKIEEISVVRGIPGCQECDEEAKRLVSIMPDWKPAEQNNNKVSVWFTLPISFTLSDN